MKREEILNKCHKLIEIIEYDLKMYEIGVVSKFLKEIPIDPTVDLDIYTIELKNIILPKLFYIRDCLVHNKKIKKSKGAYGDYIVKNWSYESSLGLELMRLYKYLW